MQNLDNKWQKSQPTGRIDFSRNSMIHYTHCDQLTHALQEQVVMIAILLLSLTIFIAFWNRDARPIYSSDSL